MLFQLSDDPRLVEQWSLIGRPDNSLTLFEWLKLVMNFIKLIMPILVVAVVHKSNKINDDIENDSEISFANKTLGHAC